MVKTKFVALDLNMFKIKETQNVWKERRLIYAADFDSNYSSTLTPFIDEFIDFYEELLLIYTFNNDILDSYTINKYVSKGIGLFNTIQLNTTLRQKLDEINKNKINTKISILVDALRTVIAIERGLDYSIIRSHNDLLA